MSDLAQRQQAFLAAILDDAAPMPQGWGNSQAAGMDVYRGNYRSALMDVLADTFERTRRYVGEKPFRQVSMHHIITHPPAGWTIDEHENGWAVFHCDHRRQLSERKFFKSAGFTRKDAREYADREHAKHGGGS